MSDAPLGSGIYVGMLNYKFDVTGTETESIWLDGLDLFYFNEDGTRRPTTQADREEAWDYLEREHGMLRPAKRALAKTPAAKLSPTFPDIKAIFPSEDVSRESMESRLTSTELEALGSDKPVVVSDPPTAEDKYVMPPGDEIVVGEIPTPPAGAPLPYIETIFGCAILDNRRVLLGEL